MDLSLGAKPFGFDRVFNPQDGGATVNSRDQLSLIVQIETLQSELRHQRARQNDELARARADGFQAGLDTARSDREQALLCAVDAVNAGVEALFDQHSDFRDALTREASELIVNVAQHLSGHPLVYAPAQAIDHAIARALAQVARGTELVIHLHPDLAPQVEALIAARQAGERRKLNLYVVVDPDIPPGDARIEWEQGGLMLDRASRETSVLRELGNLFPTP